METSDFFFYLANKNGMLAKAVTSRMEHLLNWDLGNLFCFSSTTGLNTPDNEFTFPQCIL